MASQQHGAFQSGQTPYYGNAYHSPAIGTTPDCQVSCQQIPTQQQKPELPRSISTTNLETTSRCRSVIQNDWKADAPHGGTNYFATTPGFTLILPALNDYPTDFQQFVFSRIVAKDTQENMEKEFCLNWCPNVTKLVPLYTMGDGNCLLHAASLAMWGFQDRDLVLRRAISHAVNDNIHNNTLYQRWKHNREIENQHEFGIELEPHQWDQEWQMVRQQTSATVSSGRNLESLDEFHAFVLANVLRRPIIMYAVPKLRSHQTDGTLQKINFHGVYLPLLWAPDSCKKDPLPLAYHLGHFSALVVIESAQQYRDGHLLLPLSDYYSQRLPVRFILPVEDPDTMMMDYLDLVQVPVGGSPYFSHESMVCAKLTISDIPSYLKPLISGFIDSCHEAYITQKPQNQSQSKEGPSDTSGLIRPQCINNCGMYGDLATGLCSKCHHKAIGAAHAQEKAAFEEKTSQQPQGQFQQHEYEYSRQSNSAGVGQQSTSISGAIKCPRCSNPGHPSFLGMCERCFSSTSTKQNSLPGMEGKQQQWSQPQNVQGKDPVYEVLPSYQNSPQQAQPLHAQHPPALPPPRNTSDGPVERSQCRTPGCDFFGTRETRFYCSKCFESNMEEILKEVDGTNTSNTPRIPSQHHPPPTSSDEFKQHSFPPLPSPSTLPHPSSPSPPIQEPPKCYKCKEFFASDEYSGMCHGCFMKMTKAESQRVIRQNQSGRVQTEPMYNSQAMQPNQQFYQNRSPPESCVSAHCTNPATENGYCEYCNAAGAGSSVYQQPQNLHAYQSPLLSTSSHEHGSQIPPVPKPRTKFATQNQSQTGSTSVSQPIGDHQTTTAPIVNLTSSITDMSVSASKMSKCFLCTGGNISVNNFVCEHHARLMREVVPTQFVADSHVRPFSDDGVRSKPTNTLRSASPYEEPHLSRVPQPTSAHGVNSSVGGDNIPFGVPLPHRESRYDAGPVLGAAGEEFKSRSFSQAAAGFRPYQENHLPAINIQQKAVHSDRLNDFGSPSVDNPSQPAAYGGHHVMGGMAMAIGVDDAVGGGGGGGGGHPPPKTLCATPGCSFKGYKQLSNLCPDCYQEKYKAPPPPGYPLV